ncbi:TPA: hypothetical protein ACK8SK_003080 [Legionella pneumophila]|nr:hypothetical protein [Legionella pneumophila]
MTKKSINVIGIMIDAEYKDFKLYHLDESWEKSTQSGTYTSQSTSGDGWVEGLRDILGYLSIPSDANTQFVIVYDISCLNKEEHIKKLLTGINKIKKSDLLPTLISIGHEQSPWNEDITSQVSIFKEVENTGARNDLLKNIVRQELNNIKVEETLLFIDKIKQFTTSFFDKIKTYIESEKWNDWQKALDFVAHARKELNISKSEIEANPFISEKDRAKFLVMLTSFNKEMFDIENEIRTKMKGVLQKSRDTETHSSSTMNFSMMVLGGFIAAAGIAAVAIAFTVLNAATFGIAGLVVAGIGVAALLSGVGLFATGAYKNKNTSSDISLDQSNNIVPV